MNVTFSDFSLQNLEYPYQDDLITFLNIKSDKEINIILERFTFNNISFERGGNLFSFQHQQNEYLEIRDSTFTNIFNGGISIHSYSNLEADVLKTKVKMVNITTELINAYDTRFISLGEGAVLEILNSTLSTISSQRPGSVLFGGYRQTIASIFDSTFSNNTSTDGGVFSSESESQIQ